MHYYAVTGSLASEQNNGQYIVPSHAPQSAIPLKRSFEDSANDTTHCHDVNCSPCSVTVILPVVCFVVRYPLYQIHDGICENSAL